MAKYVITVADKDRKQIEYLMYTENTVFIKEWGDDAVIVDDIEPVDDARE